MKRLKASENFLGYLFMTPAIIFCLVFLVYPLILSIILPFLDWDGITIWKWIGLGNFIELFTKEPSFYIALKNTLIFAFGTTFGLIIVGFTLAVIIDMKVFLWKFYRVVFYITQVVSIVALGMLQLKIFAPEGPFNILLKKIGLPPIIWFGSAPLALLLVMLITIWQGSGMPMIFFLAGMHGINRDLYEAATIDGATTLQRIFYITIPLLRNVFAILTVMLLIFLFKVFDIIFVMTQGGPYGGTEVLASLLYKQAFTNLRFGYASAIGFIMLLVSIVLSVIYVKVSGYRRYSS